MLAGPTLASSQMRRLQGTVGAQRCLRIFLYQKAGILLHGKTKQVSETITIILQLRSGQ